jgi:hypothetical protein
MVFNYQALLMEENSAGDRGREGKQLRPRPRLHAFEAFGVDILDVQLATVE